MSDESRTFVKDIKITRKKEEVVRILNKTNSEKEKFAVELYVLVCNLRLQKQHYPIFKSNTIQS